MSTVIVTAIIIKVNFFDSAAKGGGRGILNNTALAYIVLTLSFTTLAEGIGKDYDPM